MTVSKYRRRSPQQPPWWWFLPYVVLIVIYLVVVLLLLRQGQPFAVATGVPVVISAIVVRAMTRLVGLRPGQA